MIITAITVIIVLITITIMIKKNYKSIEETETDFKEF